MKKYTVLSLALLFGMFLVTGISNNSSAAIFSTEVIALDDHKKAVEAEDLPEAVQETLKGEDYQRYTVGEAFLVTEEENSYYEIELVMGDESKTVKLTADGKKVEKEVDELR